MKVAIITVDPEVRDYVNANQARTSAEQVLVLVYMCELVSNDFFGTPAPCYKYDTVYSYLMPDDLTCWTLKYDCQVHDED